MPHITNHKKANADLPHSPLAHSHFHGAMRSGLVRAYNTTMNKFFCTKHANERSNQPMKIVRLELCIRPLAFVLPRTMVALVRQKPASLR